MHQTIDELNNGYYASDDIEPDQSLDPESFKDLCIEDAKALRDLMAQRGVAETPVIDLYNHEDAHTGDHYDNGWLVRLMTHADQAGYFGDNYYDEKSNKREIPLNSRAVGIYKVSLRENGESVRRLYAGVDIENRKFISTPKGSNIPRFYADPSDLADMRVKLQDAATSMRDHRSKKLVRRILHL